MKKLKALAEKLGCVVEDDRANTTLYVHCPEDKAWDEGSLTSLVHPYGSGGSYMPHWRQEAIDEATERLGEIGAPDSIPEESASI